MTLPELDIKEDMLDFTEKHALDWETKKQLAEETSEEWRLEPWEVEDYFTEYGAPICLTRDGRLVLAEGLSGKGTTVHIREKICEEEGMETVGSFHTHPVPPVTPSNPDLRMMEEKGYEIACIGTIAGDRVVVVCFEEPREEFRGAGTMQIERMSRMFTGDEWYTGSEEDKIGEIHMLEDPYPKPREILDKYPTIIDEAVENSDMTRQEIEDKLERGIKPDIIGRMEAEAHRPYEEIELPVYTKGYEEILMGQELSSLFKHFDNIRVYRRKL